MEEDPTKSFLIGEVVEAIGRLRLGPIAMTLEGSRDGGTSSNIQKKNPGLYNFWS